MGITHGGLNACEHLASFMVARVVGGEVDHDLVGDSDGIATDSPIVGPKYDPLCSSLNWRSPGEVLIWVVAEEGHVGHFATCWQMQRYVVGLTNQASFGDGVHARGIGRLQGRFATERHEGVICTTVGNNDDVFHS